jgi:peptidoglycan hydrolase-like protein with peptidoglycan-binding domain
LPQVDRFLRRSAALAAGVLALAVSGVAYAADTGGAEAAPAQAPAPAATPTPAPAPKPTTKQIQKALGIKADGAYGPQTRRAMKRFQRAQGLKVTGRPNRATLIALGLIKVSTDRTFDSVPSGDAQAILAKIAECESGGDITAVSRNGRYFGKYQFSQPTWEAMGGEGNPAEADEATQDALALKLYELRGTAPWPACSAKLDEA